MDARLMFVLYRYSFMFQHVDIKVIIDDANTFRPQYIDGLSVCAIIINIVFNLTI